MANQYHLFVGSYGEVQEESIHWLRFDGQEGTLRKISSVSGIVNPSFVTLNHTENRLYSVSEVGDGEVVSFAVDYTNEELIELNRQSTHGSSPCFLEVHEKDQFLFTANYGGGTISVHPLNENGEIQPASDIKDYTSQAKTLNTISHPHTIRNIPNTNKYIVTDLGLNRLFLYTFAEDIAKLQLVKEIEVPVGAGPRHIAFHPQLRRIYVINELNSTVLNYAYDEQAENVELLQTLETLPDNYEGDNYCADIHVSPSGGFVYASNRGHQSIATYKIVEDGELDYYTHTSCAGEWPRNFLILPEENYLLVANEHSNNIVVMRIKEDGSLEITEHVYHVNKPVCLKVVPVTNR